MKSKKLKWWMIVVLLFFLTYRLHNAIKPHYPESYQIQGFQTFQQPNDITCGPTSALMLLNFYNVKTNLEEIQKLAKTEWFKYKEIPVGLSTPEYLQQAIKHKGVNCSLKYGNLPLLKTAVSEGKPCVVLLRSGKSLWHYVVAIGYDQNNIIIADPGDGSIYKLPILTFESAWNFSKDMSGKDCLTTCPLCHGVGSLWVFPCDLCNGQGRIPDILDRSLFLAEVHPNTLIVPYASPIQNK